MKYILFFCFSVSFLGAMQQGRPTQMEKQKLWKKCAIKCRTGCTLCKECCTSEKCEELWNICCISAAMGTICSAFACPIFPK